MSVKYVVTQAKDISPAQGDGMPGEHERFRKMLEDSQDWFWEFDENANFTYVSPRIRDLLGYEPEEVIGLNAFDFMDASEAERVHRHFDPIAKKYLPFTNLENTNIRKDGHEIVIESSGTPIFDAVGQFMGYRGIDRDITQRKKEQEALRESKTKLQNILETSSEWIWEIDLTGRHTYSNHSLFKLLGYQPEAFVGKDYFNFLHEDDLRNVQEALPQLNAEKRGWEGWVLRWRHIDGSYRYLESNAKPIINSAGELEGYRGADRDITDRKKAEEDLQKREKLFRDFFESNPVATIITSPTGRVHMVNPAFSQASGFSVEEVVGKNSQELGFWRDLTDRERMVAAIMEDGLINDLEASFYTKHNQQLTCLVSSRAIEYEGEQRILSTVLDVTETRNAEEALRKIDQAKSDFIRIAAHELQTPLVAVLGYAELLENSSQLHVSEQQKLYASIISKNAETLSRLVDDLLDVERIQLGRCLNIVRENVSIAELIKKAIASITPKWPEHRFILTHVNSLPQRVCIDEGRVTQVLNNLLSNAAKYSPKGGIIEVSTTTEESTVTISVRDYGLGMAAEHVALIFDKFYRANPENPQISGLGLGMNIVKQIVEEHGGEISVSSNLGEGTTVTFTLPLEDIASL